MIKVGVGEDHSVNAGGLDRQRIPILLAELLQTLKETAVDEDTVAVGLQQMLGTGDAASADRKSVV